MHRDLCGKTAAVLVGLSIVTCGTAAFAAGDPEAGYHLVNRWCTSCHVVDTKGHGTDTAPAFATIAQQKNNRKWVRAWLQAPHPPMPNLNLSRQEIDDIVAYLDSISGSKP